MTARGIIEAGKVAVVTGAAGGIGKAICLKLATLGMRVCLIDIPGKALDRAVDEVSAASPHGEKDVRGYPLDVSDLDKMENLHTEIIAQFGTVDLLINNAVTRRGRGHDAPVSEWREALDVNLWGVIYGVRCFLPQMLKCKAPGMIINVGSKQGITNPPGHPIYNIAKSAVKTYSEALEHELRNNPQNQGNNRVSAHLLIPGWTTVGGKPHQEGAWLPEQVADFLLQGLERGDFYILCPDDEVTTQMDHKRILWAAQDITQNRPPLSRWHEDFKVEAKDYCG
jgi:NAD(P)-dependent dehydrogenase (short-subunit alcohol dehydrogenase family)